MKSILLMLLCGGALRAAEPATLFFASETKDETTRISLTIDGDRVTGTEVWQPSGQHGSRGTLGGIINGGGTIIQALYSYTIEGSEQSEEQVFKLEGDKLYKGEGELVDAGKGRMNLKEPGKVGFKTALKKVPVTEPKPGTPERKAIMDAMRVPVVARTGKPVLFTGGVRTSGEWARFQGSVATTDGKPPANAEAAADLNLDFFALLKKDAKGDWKVMHSGFSGDISVRDKAREDHPKAPWVLFE